MGKYSVPANIRAMKPKGTMAKIVDGKYYYAYSYTTIVGEDGKQHTKMGKSQSRLCPDNQSGRNQARMVRSEPCRSR